MRNYLPFIALICGISAVSQPALACTCSDGGDFAEFSADLPIVVRAKIVSHGDSLPFNSNQYQDMGVEIVEVVKGTYPNRVLTLVGDSGMSCLNPINRSKYPLGSEHFIALLNTEEKQGLLGCGESSVRARRSILEWLGF